jgi:Tfp pilus assembly PilM family ATPase
MSSEGLQQVLSRFGNGNRSKRKRVVAIEIGKWMVKGALLANQGGTVKVLSYVLQPAIESNPNDFRDGLPDLISAVHKALQADTKHVVISLSMEDVVLRKIQMPIAKPADLRRIVKYNPQGYLQQTLKDYSYDCCPVESTHLDAPVHIPVAPAPPEQPSEAPNAAEPAAPAPAAPEPAPSVEHEAPKKAPKKTQEVLVAGVASRIVEDYQTACEKAGLILDELVVSHVSLVNGAFFSLKEDIKNQVRAIVDIGFRNTSISIVFHGELALTRVINFGGEQITAGLAKAMESNARVAEAIKVTLPEKVHEQLKLVLTGMAFDIRTALAFFEKQFEVPVHEILLSGSTARSKLIVEVLQAELNVPCTVWNPGQKLELELPEGKQTDFDSALSQIGGVLGAGQAYFLAPKFPLNLLAELQQVEAAKRRDPVRWSIRGAAVLIMIVLAWASVLVVERAGKFVQLNLMERRTAAFSKTARAVSETVRKSGEAETTLGGLEKLQQQRFLWTGPLHALQFSVPDNIQILRLQINQLPNYVPAAPASNQANGIAIPAKPAYSIEQTTMTILAKNYGDLSAAQKFIQKLASTPYFKEHLRSERPVLLKDRMPDQTDPLNPSRTFSLFTIECFFNERIVTSE